MNTHGQIPPGSRLPRAVARDDHRGDQLRSVQERHRKTRHTGTRDDGANTVEGSGGEDHGGRRYRGIHRHRDGQPGRTDVPCRIDGLRGEPIVSWSKIK